MHLRRLHLQRETIQVNTWWKCQFQKHKMFLPNIKEAFWNGSQAISLLLINWCHGYVSRQVNVLSQLSKSGVSYLGTGPLARLSLFPVAELDKVSNCYALNCILIDTYAELLLIWMLSHYFKTFSSRHWDINVTHHCHFTLVYLFGITRLPQIRKWNTRTV